MNIFRNPLVRILGTVAATAAAGTVATACNNETTYDPVTPSSPPAETAPQVSSFPSPTPYKCST
jgi:hypothetical protein